MLRLLCAGFLLSLLAASWFALTGKTHKTFEDTIRQKPDTTKGTVIQIGRRTIHIDPTFFEPALPGDRYEFHGNLLILGVTEIEFFQVRLIRDGRELKRWNDTALHPVAIMMLIALIPFGLSIVAALFWRSAAGRKASVLTLLLACSGACAHAVGRAPSDAPPGGVRVYFASGPRAIP